MTANPALSDWAAVQCMTGRQLHLPHLCDILLRQLMRVQRSKTSSSDQLRQLFDVYMLQHMTVQALWQATVKQAGWRWTRVHFRESTSHPDRLPNLGAGHQY